MSLKGYAWKNLKVDIPIGILIALVSIPISMGYATIAGLPPVYGLYGSVLPILLFGLLTSSPRFVFGVDAAPAAMTGALLYSMGVASQSAEAIAVVPVITFFTAVWLLVFFLLDVGKLVKYISTPVMGGFITGIGCTIILMQIPKLFGGTGGRGEVFELLVHLVGQARTSFHPLSLALGLGTVLLILAGRRWAPKFPVSAILMFLGAGLSLALHLDRYGVQMLPAVEPGLPAILLPKFSSISGHVPAVLVTSFSIALVVAAETLLATRNTAMKYRDNILPERELLAYTVAMFGAAMTGSCPVNGSVSRTGIADQFGVKSQMMSVVASIVMTLLLLFGTGFIGYLPVPVLTGIVVAALISILEFGLARKLFRVDRMECVIFYAVFLTVLLFGTIYGVLAGVLLSFITVIIRAAKSPHSFLGRMPDHDGFYPMDRIRGVVPIQGVVLYRFQAPLFFANIGQFTQDLETAVKPDTRVIVVDSGGITSVDVTAAERLLLLYRQFRAENIQLFLAGHSSHVNDQLRTFGCEELLEHWAVLPTMDQALQVAGIPTPYPLETDSDTPSAPTPGRKIAAAFEWAYGEEADQKMKAVAERFTEKLMEDPTLKEKTLRQIERAEIGIDLSPTEEENFLEQVELQIALYVNRHKEPIPHLAELEEELGAYLAELHEKVRALQDDPKETV